MKDMVDCQVTTDSKDGMGVERCPLKKYVIIFAMVTYKFWQLPVIYPQFPNKLLSIWYLNVLFTVELSLPNVLNTKQFEL